MISLHYNRLELRIETSSCFKHCQSFQLTFYLGYTLQTQIGGSDSERVTYEINAVTVINLKLTRVYCFV